MTQNKVKPIGNVYELSFHVVANELIEYDLILGNEFCELAEIRITPKGLKIQDVTVK